MTRDPHPKSPGLSVSITEPMIHKLLNWKMFSKINELAWPETVRRE